MAGTGRIQSVGGVPQRYDYLTGQPLPAYYEYNGRRYATEDEMMDARTRDLQGKSTGSGQSIGTSWGETFYPNQASGYYGGTGTRTAGSAGGGSGTGAVNFAAALSQIPGVDAPWIGGGSDADDSAALAASYGRAKERSGLEAQGAARSIRALMGRRGLGGSRFALGQEGRAITGGQQNLANYNRDEAIQLAKRRQQRSDRNYAGNITQRGQTLSANAGRTNQALSLAALMQRSA